MFQVSLALFPLGADVVLDGGKFEGSLFPGMRELGGVVVLNSLEITFESLGHDSELAVICPACVLDRLRCGIGLSLKVHLLGELFDPFDDSGVCMEGGGARINHP